MSCTLLSPTHFYHIQLLSHTHSTYTHLCISFYTHMHKQYEDIHRYGYIISEIHGKKLSLYNTEMYNSLKQCESIEEVLIKIMPNYKYITEDMDCNKIEIKRRLYRSLLDEYTKYRSDMSTGGINGNSVYDGSTNGGNSTNSGINGNSAYDGSTNGGNSAYDGTIDTTITTITSDMHLSIVLDYYMENHMIHNFFYLLQSKSCHTEIEDNYTKILIGNFDALKTLKFCKDMTDVRKYCINNCFLKKYFYKIKWNQEINENDLQQNMALFIKYLIEDTYNKIQDTCLYMKHILKVEADRYIIELTYNSIQSKHITGQERKKLYPKVSTFDMKTIEDLCKCVVPDDITSILQDKYKFNKEFLIERELVCNTSSFDMYNDISCVYSYFRLKEQEIKNIIWIISCIQQDRRKDIDSLLLYK